VSNLVYLLVALVLSVTGSLILWFRHRRPTSLESGIDSFSRELKALAPDRRERERERERERDEGRAGG
jgi:hypothetical protein